MKIYKTNIEIEFLFIFLQMIHTHTYLPVTYPWGAHELESKKKEYCNAGDMHYGEAYWFVNKEKLYFQKY